MKTKTLETTCQMDNTLESIGERIRSQDNRCTENPMFCVQIKVRDFGYDPDYTNMENHCWFSPEQCEWVYKEPEDLDGWTEYGYKDHWETVMVAFTEKGCEEYLELNGYNDRRRAHNGEVRIYVESFNRCPEMIHIRSMLMNLQPIA